MKLIINKKIKFQTISLNAIKTYKIKINLKIDLTFIKIQEI